MYAVVICVCVVIEILWICSTYSLTTTGTGTQNARKAARIFTRLCHRASHLKTTPCTLTCWAYFNGVRTRRAAFVFMQMRLVSVSFHYKFIHLLRGVWGHDDSDGFDGEQQEQWTYHQDRPSTCFAMLFHTFKLNLIGFFKHRIVENILCDIGKIIRLKGHRKPIPSFFFSSNSFSLWNLSEMLHLCR